MSLRRLYRSVRKLKGVSFREATAPGQEDIAAVQGAVRKRVLRLCEASLPGLTGTDGLASEHPTLACPSPHTHPRPGRGQPEYPIPGATRTTKSPTGPYISTLQRPAEFPILYHDGRREL